MASVFTFMFYVTSAYCSFRDNYYPWKGYCNSYQVSNYHLNLHSSSFKPGKNYHQYDFQPYKQVQWNLIP